MAIPATELQDCQTITKAFERGCNFSFSEESVFAVMAPNICTMRNTAKSTAGLIKENKLQDLESSKDGDKSLYDRWTEGGLSGTDCIPCDARIDFKEQLTFQSSINQLYDFYREYFQNALKQIEFMGNLLSGKDQYADICALISYFKDFMCVPDLQRIIAALSALLMQLGLEITSLFDLVLQLIGPIMMPFLNQVIDQVNKFFINAIKPLECIINSITSHLSKLDYGAIFANPGSSKITNTINTGNIRLNKQGIDLNPISTNQAQVDHNNILTAEANLNRVRSKANSIDPKNSKAVSEYRAEVTVAKDNYQKALRQKDLTAIGQTNAQLNEALNAVRSSLFSLIKYLKLVIDKFNEFQDKLVGDFTKMLSTITGNGTNLIFSLQNKLAIVQLISLIKSIINLYKDGADCDLDSDSDNAIPAIPIRGNTVVYQDTDGNIHIEENSAEIDEAIDSAIIGIGKDPNNIISQDIDSNNIANRKLTALIKLTGQDVLDSSISRAIDAVTIPLSTKLNCTSKTSIDDAERVNQWISELNNL